MKFGSVLKKGKISIHPQWIQKFPFLSAYLDCMKNSCLHQGGRLSETHVVIGVMLAILFFDSVNCAQWIGV